MCEYVSVVFGLIKQQNRLLSRCGVVKNSCLLPVGLPVSLVPSRNTMILKRVNPVPLYKEGNKPKIYENNYVYDLVEDTDRNPEATMDVVLKTHVPGVGNQGDIVSMKRSLAYTKLLVTGLGDYPTPENLEYSRQLKKDLVLQEKRVSVTEEFMIGFLKRRIALIIMNNETEWTIEPWHIVTNLRRTGVHVMSASQIELPPQPIKGPDMDLQGKDFFVTVTINKKHRVKVRCRIHHWATSPQDRLPLDPQYWASLGDLIFPEDKPTTEGDEKPASD